VRRMPAVKATGNRVQSGDFIGRCLRLISATSPHWGKRQCVPRSLTTALCSRISRIPESALTNSREGLSRRKIRTLWSWMVMG
jgi:hypothetical protein